MKKKKRKIKSKKKRRKYEGYTNVISSENKIIVKMWTEKGVVVKFSITYLRKVGKKWLEIRRCDNSHLGVVAHCHVFRYNGNNTKILLKGSPSDLLTKSSDDFKKHYESYLDFYFKKT